MFFVTPTAEGVIISKWESQKYPPNKEKQAGNVYLQKLQQNLNEVNLTNVVIRKVNKEDKQTNGNVKEVTVSENPVEKKTFEAEVIISCVNWINFYTFLNDKC